MKLPKILYLMVLFSVVSFSCSPDSTDDSLTSQKEHTYVPQSKDIELEILELINNYRDSIGLNRLQDMSIIKAEAYPHTDYMIENNQVSHDGFLLRRENLMNNAGAISVGENVAYGYATAEAVVNAWLNSDGHRAIIEGDYTNFDISAELDENNRWYYTNIFIKK